jgi:hypothetical protein
MRSRRTFVALVVAASFVLASLGAVAPASADAPARLAYASLTTIPFGQQTLLQLKLRATGDAVRLDYEYDVTTGTIPTVRFTRSLPVVSAENTQADVLYAFSPAGSYRLAVTAVAADGSSTRYLPDGTATECTVTQVCGAPVSGVGVLSGTAFVRSSGPTTLAQMVAAAAHLTTAGLSTPAPSAHISAGATVATSMSYAGANLFSPPTGTSLFPIYQGDGFAAFFPGPSVTAVSSSGTAVSSGSGPTQGSFWKPYDYVLRTGLVDRVVTDQDRAWVHTVWPLSATSLATMPVACGTEPSFSPPSDCTLVETAAPPATANNGFSVDGVRAYSGQWWTEQVTGGSTDASAVVSNASHPIFFTVHYQGLPNPFNQPMSVTLTGPGAGTIDANSSGPNCPQDVNNDYTCSITISATNVHYNGTYRVTSVSIGTADTPTLVCAPGPTATLVGYNLLDSTSTASNVGSLCAGIAWSTLTATVTGLAAPPCTDSSPPVLTSFVRTSATAFDATNSPTSGSATFHWSATDSGCGLTQVRATFVRPDGVSWAATSTVPATASGSGSLTLTPQPGSWALQRIAVTDAAGNVRNYDSNGVASGVLAGAAQPWQRAAHPFDLASAGVLATGGPPPHGVSAPARWLSVSSLGTSLALTWQPPSPSTGVTGYTATIRSGVDGSVQAVSTAATRATFTGLDAATPYQVWVEAKVGSVVSAWTPLYGTVTPSPAPVFAPPLGAPSLASLPTVLLSTTVPLTVTPHELPGYPVSGYVLQWSHGGPSQSMSAWADRVSTGTTPPASVTGLALGTRLCVRLLAVNVMGRGPTSETRCTAIPLDDRGLSRSKGWASSISSGPYRRTLSTSTHRGATLSLIARGHGLVVLVRLGKGAGKLGVYVGRRRVAVINLASTRTRLTSVTMSSRVTGVLNGARVTLRVETSGHAVTVDGIAVLA